MREIKFRAWNKYDKEWVIFEPCWIMNGETGTFNLIYNVEHDSIILMQFTGLKDKTGKEIYEGDIVGTPDDPSYSGPVRFDNVELSYDDYTVQMNGFYVDTPLESTRLFVTEEMNTGKVSILGNIYEHPELLSKEKP